MNFVSNIGSRNRLLQRLGEKRGWILLLVLALFCGAAVLVLGMRMREVRQQYRVRMWLESVGGYVVYENGGARKTPASWLAWIDGEPILDRITEVGITSGSPPVDRRMLEMLADLRGLATVKFEVTDLVDADLLVLAECEGLRELSVARSSVTGDGFKHLYGMPNLRVLDVSFCNYSTSELRFLLESLPEIESLWGLTGYEVDKVFLRIKADVRAGHR